MLGILQGITELFPISSLGHTVIFPNLFGWHNIVKWQSQPESPWLAFVVALHVGSALDLLIYVLDGGLDPERGVAGLERGLTQPPGRARPRGVHP